MNLPADFPNFEPTNASTTGRGSAAGRRLAPDYTSRSTKIRLFAATAAIMAVLFVIERGVSRRQSPGGVAPPTSSEDRGLVSARSVKPAAPPSNLSAPPPDLASILAAYGLGRAELAGFIDGQALSGDEVELLAQLLTRLPSLRGELRRAAQPLRALEAAAAAPAEHRGEAFTLLGRAQQVVKATLPAELAERFEFLDYYSVLVELDDVGQTITLLTRRIPAAWPLDGPFEAHVAADAVFLKLLDSDAGGPMLAFAADRLAWHPDQLNAALSIGPDQLILAQRGFDMGLWDDVRESNHRPLEARDREAFYGLLAAVREGESPAEPGAVKQLATRNRPLSLANILQRPQVYQGTIYTVAGTARRITRIAVDDSEIREQLDLDHYYEIDLFLPLGDAKIRLGDRPPGQSAPEFTNSFPATLIVRELPAGLTPAANLHEPITASAVFFKIWTYDSRYTAHFGQTQPAPLFIANSFTLTPAVAPTSWLPTLLITAPLALCFAALVYVLYQTTRPRRRKPASSPPNFSHLTTPDR